MKDMINKETHLQALKVVAEAYQTVCFGGIFPLLAEDCVWESQWRLDPECGRDQVIRYYIQKEESMRGYEDTLRCGIVELVGSFNPVSGEGKDGRRVSAGLLYPDGKLCVYMEQLLDGQINGILIDLTLNEDGLITRIDLCMPELFRFRPYNEEITTNNNKEDLTMTYNREEYIKEVTARNAAKTPEERAARLAELKAKLEAGTATEQDKDEIVSMPR